MAKHIYISDKRYEPEPPVTFWMVPESNVRINIMARLGTDVHVLATIDSDSPDIRGDIAMKFDNGALECLSIALETINT